MRNIRRHSINVAREGAWGRNLHLALFHVLLYLLPRDVMESNNFDRVHDMRSTWRFTTYLGILGSLLSIDTSRSLVSRSQSPLGPLGETRAKHLLCGTHGDTIVIPSNLVANLLIVTLLSSLFPRQSTSLQVPRQVSIQTSSLKRFCRQGSSSRANFELHQPSVNRLIMTGDLEMAPQAQACTSPMPTTPPPSPTQISRTTTGQPSSLRRPALLLQRPSVSTTSATCVSSPRARAQRVKSGENGAGTRHKASTAGPANAFVTRISQSERLH